MSDYYPKDLQRKPARAEFEANEMRAVHILLSDLFDRQSPTVLRVLDHLLKVGTPNLMESKIKSKTLQHVAKRVAGTSKPVVRQAAHIWFQREVPTLLTDWLYSQVTFKEEESNPQDTSRLPAGVADPHQTAIVSATMYSDLQKANTEVRVLEQLLEKSKTRARRLLFGLVATTAVAAGSIGWGVYQYGLPGSEAPVTEESREAVLPGNVLQGTTMS